ncbi:Hypothetical Protein FCC1311_082122 [Hondaea fermentalgiana]|uniref:Uncharacterized protein n=1 Tax=Hondaea fermentalgiana TaxID=2315210 RepID=A0A2R5GM78_9STRA|nr:Hypothetical Protein FCC1311_082122 [Hondaea fermentalgiana]|eukprot:GBG31987.1 Hypothetical Protein FCC1311_082122 [Hondaea fermentalgiana]
MDASDASDASEWSPSDLDDIKTSIADDAQQQTDHKPAHQDPQQMTSGAVSPTILSTGAAGVFGLIKSTSPLAPDVPNAEQYAFPKTSEPLAEDVMSVVSHTLSQDLDEDEEVPAHVSDTLEAPLLQANEDSIPDELENTDRAASELVFDKLQGSDTADEELASDDIQPISGHEPMADAVLQVASGHEPTADIIKEAGVKHEAMADANVQDVSDHDSMADVNVLALSEQESVTDVISTQAASDNNCGTAPSAHSQPTSHNPKHADKLYLDHVRAKINIRAVSEQLQAEQCPFAPKLTKLASRFASHEGEKRYDRLYMGAQVRQEKLKEKRQVVDPECSFKPVITPKAARRRKSTGRGGGKAGVFDRLHATAARTQQSLEAKRKVLDADIGNVSGEPTATEPPVPPPNPARLCPDKQALQEAKRAMEKRRTALTLRECTFKPVMVARRSLPDRITPLEIRRTAVLEKREARRQALRAQLEERERLECTFTPQSSVRRHSAGEAPRKPGPLVLDAEHVRKLTMRLYSDAKLLEAKHRLLRESALAESAAASVHRHLSKWNMQRINFLYTSGTEILAQRRARASDPNFRHSLDIARELSDLKECSFAPRVGAVSEKLDALLLHRCDPELASSPRHIRLYKDARRLQLHLDELKVEDQARIDEAAATAFDATSPTLQRQRKRKSDHDQTMRLYEDARRIDERKERLYHHLRVQEQEKRNIRFSALNITTVDQEMRRDGPISPGNLISPRSPDDQQTHLVSMHERHQDIQNALETVRSTLDNEERARNETRFSSDTIDIIDQARAASPSAFDVRKARDIMLQAKGVSPRSPRSPPALLEALSPRAKLEQKPKLGAWHPGSATNRAGSPSNFDVESVFSDEASTSVWRASRDEVRRQRLCLHSDLAAIGIERGFCGVIFVFGFLEIFELFGVIVIFVIFAFFCVGCLVELFCFGRILGLFVVVWVVPIFGLFVVVGVVIVIVIVFLLVFFLLVFLLHEAEHAKAETKAESKTEVVRLQPNAKALAPKGTDSGPTARVPEKASASATTANDADEVVESKSDDEDGHPRHGNESHRRVLKAQRVSGGSDSGSDAGDLPPLLDLERSSLTATHSSSNILPGKGPKLRVSMLSRSPSAPRSPATATSKSSAVPTWNPPIGLIVHKNKEDNSPPPPAILLRPPASRGTRTPEPKSPDSSGSGVIHVKMGDKTVTTTADDISELGSLGSLDLDAFLDQVDNDGPDDEILELLN